MAKRASLIMSSEDRVISMGAGLAAIPERLLLAHARGEVLFICGAGISMPAGLHSFRELVLDVYKVVDPVVHAELSQIPAAACNKWDIAGSTLTHQQKAEVRRFILNDFDVVLGMLERRIDGQTDKNSIVRNAIKTLIENGRVGLPKKPHPSPIHRAIMRLSNRGSATAVITTNFDLLLEKASVIGGARLETYSLNSLPRPTRRPDFSGIFHIHGALEADNSRISDLIVTDQDFGDAYLRQRNVPDFIYDLTRLYHLVLIGYSANDPPMRYLLNAVASDEARFSDIKDRYVFTPSSSPDPVALVDWRARGILPIEYDSKNQHEALRTTLERWAKFSVHSGRRSLVEAELRRIVKKPRALAQVEDQDLFAHLFRRDPGERVRLAAFISGLNADIGWLELISEVCNENEKGRRL
jgi:NAD-dependent SIR2 family protein deacetylase